MYPKKIIVGYNKRTDCYTGKLAYVIYRDEKGVNRKENSWNSWRDKTMGSDEFDNVPTSGFILNRHVGGYKSGWNFRQSYCRIYDPRGFEFEISMENLLYILDWVDCFHGKGLDGEFVYMWNGTDLWLEPVCTEEYTKEKEEQDKLFKSTPDIELVPGTEYLLKKKDIINKKTGVADTTVIYIGDVKVDQDFGKGFCDYKMFIPGSQANCCGDTDEVFITFKELANIKDVVKKDAISYAAVENLKDRFNLSAYSHEFWNSCNKVKRFIADKVDFYHDPAVEAFTKHYENCFYVDPSGEFVHPHIPLITNCDISNRYYSSKTLSWMHKSYGSHRGYIASGRLNTSLIPTVEVSHEYKDYTGKMVTYTRKERPSINIGHISYDTIKDAKGDVTEYKYHVYKCLNILWTKPFKSYKKAEPYFEDKFYSIYGDTATYVFAPSHVDTIENASDCWYETTDGYMSDSITRLNVLNHLTQNKEAHIATVMTLPYKKNA